MRNKLRSPFTRLMGEVMREFPLYSISVLSTIAYLVLSMFMRSMTGQVMDAATTQDGSFWFKLALMVIAPIAEAPFHTSSMITKFSMSERVVKKLRIAIGEKSTRLSMPALEEQQSGDIMSHLGDEMRTLSGFVGYGLSMITTVITQIVGVTWFMVVIDVQLTLVLMGVSLLILPFSLMMTKPLAKYEKSKRDALGAAAQTANEGLSATIVIKSFRLEDIVNTRYWKALGEALKADLRSQFVQIRTRAASVALGLLPMIVMLTLGAVRIANGTLTSGELLSLALIGNGFITWLTQTPRVFTIIQQARGACQRIYQYLDLPEEEGGTYAAPNNNAPVVAFDKVRFAYKGSDRLLDEVSFEISKGETVALVGESGCGKSTMLKLICGFLHPTSGSVSVCGGAVRDWELKPLRQQLALVAQDSYLFPGSIRDNLLAADNSATERQLLEVCERAGLSDFIAERGLDAQVGERGIQVSGGERQRLSIARAMLKDAPLLLLDEPTSALDAASEHIVQQSLERLMFGRTTLVVAHRLSTIRHADRILIVKGGVIADSGTHDELISRNSFYKSLYNKQLLQEEEI